ncbi:MAG: cytochrome c peroxidase [Halieaceae bacterium]|jgi:cytochrome c peroxidase
MGIVFPFAGIVLSLLFSPLALSQIVLKADCPPGFEEVASRCELRSLYQLYPSYEFGVGGGLKTALPIARDGFSPQQIDLGRYLFFDPLLSGDGSTSCASCHQPDLGFSDGLGRSRGFDGKPLPRSAPTLWNVAFQERFFWDGRATSLEQQMQGPLYAESEMANTPVQLLASLRGNAVYRQLFSQAFPDVQAGIELSQIYTAITAFEASLVSLNSRYDQYAHGYHAALTEHEKEGLNVFRSFVARCAECHTPPLFTNRQFAVIGTPELEGEPRDAGAGKTFDDLSMTGAFKVPSLRNIDLTAPYMHSGRFSSLREAAEFYTLGRGHALNPGEDLKLHWHIWEPELSETELDRLVDFMKTLTDEQFKPDEPKELPSGLPLVYITKNRGEKL